MVSSFQFPVPLEDSHREIAPLATKRQDHVQLGDASFRQDFQVLVTALFGGAIPGR